MIHVTDGHLRISSTVTLYAMKCGFLVMLHTTCTSFLRSYCDSFSSCDSNSIGVREGKGGRQPLCFYRQLWRSEFLRLSSRPFSSICRTFFHGSFGSYISVGTLGAGGSRAVPAPCPMELDSCRSVRGRRRGGPGRGPFNISAAASLVVGRWWWGT